MMKKRTIVGIIVFIVILISVIILMKNKNTDYVTYDTSSPPRIGEVHLIVSNLGRSVEFYQQIIGFEILTKESNRVILTADGLNPMLILEVVDDSVKKPLGTTGLYHFAILLPNRQSLANALVHLAESEYPMQGTANHQYSDALYLAAPDGNGIEIYVDYPPEKWQRDREGLYVGGSHPIDIESLLKEATHPWNGLPGGTRIGHMHLQVAELKIAEKFYVDGLGFKITSEGNGSLFISKDNYHHHIALNTWSDIDLPPPPGNSRGLKKFTVFFTQEEIDHAKLQLQRLDIPFEDNNGTLFVVDPSGNTVEILMR